MVVHKMINYLHLALNGWLIIIGTLREPSDDQTSDIAGSVTTKILGSCNLKVIKWNVISEKLR